MSGLNDMIYVLDHAYLFGLFLLICALPAMWSAMKDFRGRRG